jgi:hypothetical protein
MAWRWREIGALLAIVAGGLALFASPASACDCQGLSTDSVTMFDAVFIGTAVDSHASDLGRDYYDEVLFEVDEVFVGRVHEREPVLADSGGGGDCGVEPPIGVSEGIAATRHPDGFLEVNFCSFADADEVRRLFTAPEPQGAAGELASLQADAVLVPGQGPDIALPSTWGRRKIGAVVLAVVVVASIAIVAYRRRSDEADDHTIRAA